MNRNIFAKRKVQKKDMFPSSTKDIEQPVVSEKYNPDVVDKFNRIKKYTPMENIDYSKNTWKGITEAGFDFDPRNTDNFICATDHRDYEKIKKDTEDEIRKREHERLVEEEQLKKIKEENLESILKMEDEICGDEVDDRVVAFNELKLGVDRPNSEVMMEAHDDYNTLLNQIRKL